MTKQNDTIEIGSLNLLIGKREITLTIDEAKRLKTALEDLFGAKEVHHNHIHTKEIVRDRWPWNYWSVPMYSTTGLGGNNAVGSLTDAADKFKAMYDANRLQLSCNVNDIKI